MSLLDEGLCYPASSPSHYATLRQSHPASGDKSRLRVVDIQVQVLSADLSPEPLIPLSWMSTGHFSLNLSKPKLLDAPLPHLTFQVFKTRASASPPTPLFPSSLQNLSQIGHCSPLSVRRPRSPHQCHSPSPGLLAPVSTYLLSILNLQPEGHVSPSLNSLIHARTQVPTAAGKARSSSLCSHLLPPGPSLLVLNTRPCPDCPDKHTLASHIFGLCLNAPLREPSPGTSGMGPKAKS